MTKSICLHLETRRLDYIAASLVKSTASPASECSQTGQDRIALLLAPKNSRWGGKVRSRREWPKT